MFFLLLLPFTIVVSRVMPFISFSLNAVCEQAQGGFFRVPCLHEDTQPWRQLSLVFCQNQGASDYSIILKWCPFYFPPPVLSPVLWFVVCTDLFASLILWNVWHNQSSLGTFFFFFFYKRHKNSLDEKGGRSENTLTVSPDEASPPQPETTSVT